MRIPVGVRRARYRFLNERYVEQTDFENVPQHREPHIVVSLPYGWTLEIELKLDTMQDNRAESIRIRVRAVNHAVDAPETAPDDVPPRRKARPGHQAEIETLQQEVEQLRREKADVEQERDRIARERNETNRRADLLQKEVATLKEKLCELESRPPRDDLDTDINEQSRRHAAELDRLKREHDAALVAQANRFENEKSKLEEAHEREAAEMLHSAAANFNQERVSLQQKLQKTEADLKEKVRSEAATNAALQVAEAQLSALRAGMRGALAPLLELLRVEAAPQVAQIERGLAQALVEALDRVAALGPSSHTRELLSALQARLRSGSGSPLDEAIAANQAGDPLLVIRAVGEHLRSRDASGSGPPTIDEVEAAVAAMLFQAWESDGQGAVFAGVERCLSVLGLASLVPEPGQGYHVAQHRPTSQERAVEGRARNRVIAVERPGILKNGEVLEKAHVKLS